MLFEKKLTDEDFGLVSQEMGNVRHRFGARGIVLNDLSQVAIIYKEKKNEYKLPGGGIEGDETPEEAFLREVLEETGCIVEISNFLGIFEEIKSQDNFLQTSYVYFAHVIEDTKKYHYTKQEIEENTKLLWCDLDEAIRLLQSSEDKLISSDFDGPMSIYHTRFIVRRDLEILKYWQLVRDDFEADRKKYE